MRSKGTQTAIKSLLGSLALICAFYVGTVMGQPSGNAQTSADSSDETMTGFSPKVESMVVESTTTVFVEKPTKVIEYVEKITEIPAEIRNFESLGELKQWLADAEKNANVIFFQPLTGLVDCDDYAVTLQRMAISGGYLMSLEITESNEYNKLFKQTQLPSGTLHAINLVIIGNGAYYIEPQTGEVVFASYLD